MKIKLTSVIYLLTFLVFFGFLGLENYLVLLLAAIIVLTGIKSCGLNKAFCVLALFLTLHTLIYLYNRSSLSLDWLAKNALNPLILFFVGYWLAERSSDSKKPVMTLVLGFFIHAGINVVLYIRDPSSMTERSFSNIWGGQITATLHNLLFVPVVALLFYAIYFCRSRLWKFLLIAASVIGIYGTVVSASRTLLYLIIIIFMINLVLNSLRRDMKKTKTYITLFFLVFVLLVAYELDAFGIRSWVEASSLSERFQGNVTESDSVLGNVRWDMTTKVIVALKDHPFGNITVVNYAHNLFLDMAKYTGIFPALGIFLWCLVSVIRYISFTLKKERNSWNIAVIGISIAFMTVFFLEPVLEGLPIIFSAFCYLCGIMTCQRRS